MIFFNNFSFKLYLFFSLFLIYLPTDSKFHFPSVNLSFHKISTCLWRSFWSILHFCAIAKRFSPIYSVTVFPSIWKDYYILVNRVVGHVNEALTISRVLFWALRGSCMESQLIFNNGMSLLAHPPVDSSPESGAAAHPWSCLPQHGGVRGCVHKACHHGPRQLSMPGFPTAHQKQVRAVFSFRCLLWICSWTHYNQGGTRVGMVQAPHGLGGETEAAMGRVCVKHHHRGCPLAAPQSPAFPRKVFCPQGHPLSLWWHWEGSKYHCRVKMKWDQKHPHGYTKPHGKMYWHIPHPERVSNLCCTWRKTPWI